MTRRRPLLAALAAWTAAPLAAQTPATPFPSRLVRMVPFGTAGGPIDSLARVYAERLQARWGQPVIVEAKPGASGILAADFVSFLAAVVLYLISVGNVRGFAFTLGLTTLIDVAVAFLFTRPLVSLFARNSWFASGSAMTGLSPHRLGVESIPVSTGRRRPASATGKES